MTEIKTELKTYRVEKVCEKCGEGFMRGAGCEDPTLLSKILHSCTYYHQCSNDSCKHTQFLDNHYPTVRYEEIKTQEPLLSHSTLKLRVGGKYITSSRMVVDIIDQITHEGRVVYIDFNGKTYSEQGINFLLEETSAIFQPDHLVIEVK